jgi:hypothetical protein
MKLTEKRLLEIGFQKREWSSNVYFYNNGFSLFPYYGAYIIGWALGLPSTGDYDKEQIPVINNEKELRDIITRINHNIPLKD